jgi:hypothetical protein
MIEFRKNITDYGLFDAYKNGSIPLPTEIGSLVWNVSLN